MTASAMGTRSHRLLAGLLAALLAGAGLVEAASADPVVLQPGELVVNGDAEQAVTVGWTGSLQRHAHASGGYPGSVIVDSAGAAVGTYPGGAALFSGAGGSSTATQIVDLTPSAAAIDNGNVDALLSAYVGGYANQRDNATLTYTFRDGGGAILATVVFGPVTAADRGNASGFIAFSQTQPLPIGTRDAVLTIDTQRFVAPANDGYVDNVSLILDAPSPVAAPDTASTSQGVAVTLTPYSNDTPGAGAAIVPNSVRLLNGTTPVTSLTTAEGTYLVDTVTGAVEFTPVPSFYGTTTAVPYRITDSSGQSDDSNLTIAVAFVPTPSLSLVKSASPSDPADYVLGAAITYSFVVSNTGNITINNLTITEDSFTGSAGPLTVTCPTTTLAPGAQTVCTAPYIITATDVAALGIQNAATATGTPDGSAIPVDSNQSSFDVPVVPNPAISLVKTVDAAGATSVGDAVVYSFLVTNTGNVPVDAVTVTEDSFTGTGSLPTASCPAATLQPGQFTICTATYALTQADIDAGTVDNAATASANPASGGAAVASNQSTASVTIASAPAFSFAKTANRSAVTAAGQAIVYTFRVSNTGNVTLSNPVINETSFTGNGALSAITCAGTSVAPGGHVDCTATYTTIAADLAEVSIANSATADIDDPQLNTLSAPISSVAIPVILPDPDAGAPGGAALANTGSNPTPSATAAALLILAGIALLAVSGIARRSMGPRKAH